MFRLVFCLSEDVKSYSLSQRIPHHRHSSSPSLASHGPLSSLSTSALLVWTNVGWWLAGWLSIACSATTGRHRSKGAGREGGPLRFGAEPQRLRIERSLPPSFFNTSSCMLYKQIKCLFLVLYIFLSCDAIAGFIYKRDRLLPSLPPLSQRR